MSVNETLKDVVKLAHDVNNMDLYRKLLDFQTEVFDLTTENRDLRDQVGELKRAAEFREQLEFDKNVYWLGTGEDREGPFCPHCYDKDGKTRRMQVKDRGRNYGCFDCLFFVNSDGDGLDPRMANRFVREFRPGEKDLPR